MPPFLSRTLRTFAAIAAAAILILSASAQVRRFMSVSGYVRDDVTQKPMDNLRVELHADTGELIAQAFTNTIGEFDFTGLRAGNYILIIQLKGYEPVRDAVDLTATSHGGLFYSLRPAGDEAAKKVGPGSDQPSVSARELQLPPKAQDALHKGLDKLYVKKDPAGSIPLFQKVLEISPDFYEAHYYIGMAYMFMGKLPEAESSFHTAIERSEDRYPDPRIALATLQVDNHHPENAIENAQRGIELDPQSWQAHLELAKAFFALNRVPEAERSALKARKLKPDFPDLYITLANIHIRTQNAQALLDDVNTYLKLAPNGPYSDRARDIKTKVESQLLPKPIPQDTQN
ncbi:MAG TPA: tetratricopeptide repeat protein [Candidatus Acidoferrales bacterium]|nr:tetratricopeptide repeat protein [Candidatus Acidoferrales bacterium]